MRKNAGFMIITLLLLIVPALANAWTLTVKVAGGNATTSNVTVAYGTTTKVVKGGTLTVYPTSAATITVNGTALSTTLDGNPAVSPVVLSSGSHTVKVTYDTATTSTGLSITQAAGGQIYAQSPNKTWTSTGLSGLAIGSVVPVTIAADGNHKIVNYSLDGGAAITTGVTGAAGQVLPLSVVAAGQTITASYGLAAKISASLFAPTDGVTNSAVNCSVTASSNDTGLTYAYAVTGPASFSQAASATQTFSFTPTVVGTYVVTATVGSAAGGSAVATANVVVSDAALSANSVCTSCHNSQPVMAQHSLAIAITCTNCHTPAPHTVEVSCLGCHAIAQNSNGSADNEGVRAIKGEFSKWSHHVTGVTLQDAHCAACHLEGKVQNGKVIVNTAKHINGDIINLRNADDDTDYAWDPANPDHSLMDNFCMSCHDSNGATSAGSVAIQGVIVPAAGKTASAGNPFGDTISNRYDKMQRPAVVDAKGQFNTSNPSHHAVLGQKYSGRTRAVGPRQITNAAAFAANSSATLVGKRSTIYDSRVTKTNLPAQNYDVSKFVETYETLSPAPNTTDKTLGDDSVLHCGDCHTVGQFRQSDVGVAPKNAAVIGAHGSNNEYLLRNSIGTDERHVGQTYSSASGINTYTNLGSPLLVCFNCHSYQAYGSIGNATGATGTNHAGEYANANRCNGPVNTITFAGYTTSINAEHEPYAFRLGLGQRDGIVTGSTSTSDTDFSNLFGIQCANCHNAGPNNAFGGIHGAKVQSYTDANGTQQAARRFLPGLGNTMFVPGSAAGVGSVSDLNWEVKSIGTVYNALKSAGVAGGGAVIDNGGCYTLVPETGPGGTNADYALSPAFEQTVDQPAAGTHLFGTWGGCDDHRGNAHGKAFSANGVPAGDYSGGTVPTGGAGVTRKVLRPVTY